MIGQTKEEITRIFKLDIILEMTLDRKVEDKEEEEEITEEEVLEEIEAVITEIAGLRTHISMVITTTCFVSLHGLQLNQFQQLHRIQLFQTSPKDKLADQLGNW
jgi:hypothetical protein